MPISQALKSMGDCWNSVSSFLLPFVTHCSAGNPPHTLASERHPSIRSFVTARSKTMCLEHWNISFSVRVRAHVRTHTHARKHAHTRAHVHARTHVRARTKSRQGGWETERERESERESTSWLISAYILFISKADIYI